MQSRQSFFRNGRWVPHAQFLEMKELENQPEPKAPKGDSETAVTLAALKEMPLEDLVEMYKSYAGKHPGPRYSKSVDWLITKILEYVK